VIPCSGPLPFAVRAKSAKSSNEQATAPVGVVRDRSLYAAVEHAK
jgi:hypothetical protein